MMCCLWTWKDKEISLLERLIHTPLSTIIDFLVPFEVKQQSIAILKGKHTLFIWRCGLFIFYW